MGQVSGVQSVDRVLSIIEEVSLHPDGVYLAELSKACGLNKSTVHRLLSSLCVHGYVKKAEGSDGKYALTLKLFEIGGRTVENMSVLEVAKPLLSKLRDTLGETVHLVVREGNYIVYVFKTESQDATYRILSRIGFRREMYCTAAGKSLLAALPDSEIEQIWNGTEIKAYTENTITTWDRLLEEIEKIRRCGYAIDDEENEPYVHCIATALPPIPGQSHMAFSVSAPAVRMTWEKKDMLAKQLLDTKRQIMEQLGMQA